MVHFDAHTDTADEAYNGEKFHHGTPFRRAVEEGLLDPKRVIQIGIRDSTSGGDYHQFSHDSGMRVIYNRGILRDRGGESHRGSPPRGR
jgi:guanidinopropionase